MVYLQSIWFTESGRTVRFRVDGIYFVGNIITDVEITWQDLTTEMIPIEQFNLMEKTEVLKKL